MDSFGETDSVLEPLEPLKSIYHDDAIIAKILTTFLKNLPDYVDSIRQATATGEWSKAAAVCHRLKGTAAGYGYPDIADVSGTLEVALLNDVIRADQLEDMMKRLETLDQCARMCVHESH